MIIPTLAFLALAPVSAISRSASPAATLADAPPMGWNSYDCFGYAVTEEQVKANAQYMSDHLKPLGWEYVVIDYVWSAPKLGIDTPGQNAQFQPRLAMDTYGRLIPDPVRFPSSANGKGFEPLATWLHSKGLKFGIHLMRGIPRQAVAQNTPIFGSKAKAAEAANKKSPCGWLNHMWGINMGNPAGQQYLDSIFKLYASWGVDFVKVDDLSNPYSTAEVEGYRDAIEHCGRPIVLSLSPGPTPLTSAHHVASHANMWRLLGDLWDNWDQLDNAFESVASWNPYRKPGHWPDPDMLPLGQLRVFGPRTGPPNTVSRFNHNEIQTLMTLWSISKSPLMFGGNLPQTDPFTLAAITNPILIDIDQHSINNRPLVGGEHPVWTADAVDPRVKYLALFNREDQAAVVTVRLSDIGVASCRATDAWAVTPAGQRIQNSIGAKVPPHGVVLFVLSVRQPATITQPDNAKPDFSGTNYEAEAPTNTFLGATGPTADVPGGKCSGGKLVRNVGSKPANVLRFNHVVVPKDGEYTLTIMYMTAEKRQMLIGVNGEEPVSVTFYPTGGFDGRFLGWKEVKLKLKAGDNSLDFGNPKAWCPDIDRIIVR